MSQELELDIAIIGGGIAGLWLLSLLRRRGYGAVLVESHGIGAGQTLCSQGIIEGGQWRRTGDDAPPEEVQAASGRWHRCLAGEGEVDLRGVEVLADHQYLWWATDPFRVRLGRLLRRRSAVVATVPDLGPPEDDLPPALNEAGSLGEVFRVDGLVLDTASLVRTLAESHRERLFRIENHAVVAADGGVALRRAGGESLVLRPRRAIFTAGAGNAALGWAPVKLRPMHMVMVRGESLPGGVYAHVQGTGEKPRLTITSHHDAEGRTVWYLGGELAQGGARREPAEQVRLARRELAALLPWVDLRDAEFATLRVERAAARPRAGDSPDLPGTLRVGTAMAAWPTRLALTPLLGDRVLAALERDGIEPQPTDLGALDGWPHPAVVSYPWDQDLQWS